MSFSSDQKLIRTCLVVLAVQNMNVCNAVNESHDIEFKALEGSLNMMSKGSSGTAVLEWFTDDVFFAIVLNDVLDLWVRSSKDSWRLLTSNSNRMDSGKFENYNKVGRHLLTLSACPIMTGFTALRLPPSHAVPVRPPETRRRLQKPPLCDRAGQSNR